MNYKVVDIKSVPNENLSGCMNPEWLTPRQTNSKLFCADLFGSIVPVASA